MENTELDKAQLLINIAQLNNDLTEKRNEFNSLSVRADEMRKEIADIEAVNKERDDVLAEIEQKRTESADFIASEEKRIKDMEDETNTRIEHDKKDISVDRSNLINSYASFEIKKDELSKKESELNEKESSLNMREESLKTRELEFTSESATLDEI